MAHLWCRSLLIGPQGCYLGPRAPARVESGPTPTDQRLRLRHARPPSANSSEGLIRAILEGWDVDGSLLLLGELRKSFKLHSGPHLGSPSADTEQTPRLPVDPLAFKAEVEGSCVRSYVGSPRDDVRGGMLREPTSSIFIHPWVLLVRCIRAQDASFYESESSSSQTKPSPSQVPSSRSPALL